MSGVDIDWLALRQCIGEFKETVRLGFEMLGDHLKDLKESQERVIETMQRLTPVSRSEEGSEK